MNGIKKIFAPAADALVFLGAVALAVPELCRRRNFRWREFFYYFDLCGSRSVLIVLLISLLMGAVMGIQGVLQMSRFGAEIFMADLIGFSILKELGPLMVAVIATGRAGSAFAAEIGTMKVNEELSALHTLGINQEAYLVLPKISAMIIAMPLLCVCGDVAGIFGGMIVGISVAGIPASAYWARTIEVLHISTLLGGLFKSVIFGILITLAGCYCGFYSAGDALGVGRAATRAVVMSIFLIVISDAVMTMLLSLAGW